ncbi:eec87730-e41e-40bc-a9d4-17d6dc907b95 [Thermothielavioides terrestris]|uniref:Eec87730-e41e-40bc-a9d4-17d6dc907b95 n=1 Tax=Thermothielavioides terrestris TaxID=2587410 RepID=A0A3S4F229_9PEZI|nr:eec87730-e41e-40bc-a9d4-17d6dc907b95 [Thermothielavioides terrestris]
MRGILGFAVALLTTAVSLVSADDTSAALQALPKCALACLADGITHSACASNLTAACMCTDEPLQEQLTLCVTANCTVKETLVAKNITDTSCGVPVRDRGAAYDTATIVLFVIAACTVVLRLGFKLLVTRSLSADDYAVFLLILVVVPSVVFTHYGTTPNGVGRDIWTLTPQNITDFLYYFYLMAMFYFLQVMLLKLCLLLFYLRIFPSQSVRRLLWGTIVLDVVFGVVFFFLAIFQCSPISYFWTNWDGEHEGKCLNSNAIAWANAAISIALDLWMLAIPLAQLKTLNLHWKKKIGVGLMFCVGTFVTVVSILRLQALVTFGKSNNATWDNFPVSLWSTVEISVGIMCTCMPTLRLLLVRLFPVLGGGTKMGNGYYFSGGGPAASGKVRSSRNRGLRDSSSRSKHASTHPGSSVDTVPVKPTGIMRQQTFAVQYDDDETSLVHMRGLEHNGRSALGVESVS